MLIIVTGLPGTGKTTFACALAKKIGARHYNTDMIREDMDQKGQYDDATKKAVYKEMQNLTAAALHLQEDVLVDATFYKESLREPYIGLAEQAGVRLWWIELKASDVIVRERIRQDRPYSEADFEVYKKIKKKWQPLKGSRLVLWSDQLNLEQMVNKALDHMAIYQ